MTEGTLIKTKLGPRLVRRRFFYEDEEHKTTLKVTVGAEGFLFSVYPTDTVAVPPKIAAQLSTWMQGWTSHNKWMRK